MKTYLCKMSGGKRPVDCTPLSEILWSWLGAFLGLGAVAWLSGRADGGVGGMMLIGSFGATAVLIYGAPGSPLAQPRNVLGGHVLSALVGTSCQALLAGQPWLAAPLAVATAIALMRASGTLHPPGGATALIAVTGGRTIHELGFSYALTPVAAGAAVMVLAGLVVNNIPQHRRYPLYWL